jgi:signal peptidase I
MRRKPRTKSRIREHLESIGIAVGVVLLLKVVFIGNYMVPTGSMMPTIGVGDRLLAVKFPYGAPIPFTSVRVPGYQDPRYGDIVVFEAPHYESPGLALELLGPVVYTLTLGQASLDRQPRYYVKRCIGLPGDTIEIRGGRVTVNGTHRDVWWDCGPAGGRVAEDGAGEEYGPVTVPEGRYFMLGDNRGISYDSRYWGFVARNKIYGRVFLRIWPLGRFGPVR